jgi:hypothetical protein
MKKILAVIITLTLVIGVLVINNEPSTGLTPEQEQVADKWHGLE